MTSIEPIFDLQTGDFDEVLDVSREHDGIRLESDAGNFEVFGADLHSCFAKGGEPRLSKLIFGLRIEGLLRMISNLRLKTG